MFIPLHRNGSVELFNPMQEFTYRAFTLIQIPALKDNYIYLLYSAATRECAVIDAPMAAPVLDVLEQRQWKLSHIFNTHHHGDHIGANHDLNARTHCEIIGYAGDAPRIPGITRTVDDKQIFFWGNTSIEVMFLPGHTLGHIAYYLSEPGWFFCGDTLFLMGCGRLFEGTAEQMFASLQRIKELPDETLIFCAHEYTQTNGRFALTVDSENKALTERMKRVNALRNQNLPTVPASLAEEKQTNPFLRCQHVEEFKRLRELRNDFS